MRIIRRAIAIAIMAASLSVGLSATAGAGELCVRARLTDPVDQVKLCTNTNPQV